MKHVDEFDAYVEDKSNFMCRDIFHAVCAYGDMDRMKKLLTRSLYITKSMIQRAPEQFREILLQYRLDWILWVKAPGITDPSIVDSQYATSNPDRLIDDKTAYQRLLSIGDTEEDDEEEELEDEMDIIDGRLRWYQQRPGSLYCGLYAIQHVLNNDSEITKEDLDTLAPNTLSNAAVDDDTKRALMFDYIDPNGNYNIRTLVRAIENAGYVTRLKYDSMNVDEININNVRGIIANRGGSHWYAFRPYDDKWEVCDSLQPRAHAFPVRTLDEVAESAFISAYFLVIEPGMNVPEWVASGHKKRLAQLLWQIANPDDS